MSVYRPYGWMLEDGEFIETTHEAYLDDNEIDGYDEAYQLNMLRVVEGDTNISVENKYVSPNNKQMETLIELAFKFKKTEINYYNQYRNKTLWSKNDNL